MTVNLRIKNGAIWQGVCGEKMLAWAKPAGRAILQPDLHATRQYEKPLWVGGAMKSAGKPHRTQAQLQSSRGLQG
jgi:hypothetical protein